MSNADSGSLHPATLKALPREGQLQALEQWFRHNFEDPQVDTNYDSEDGEYKYMHGGPFEASDELRSEFEGAVPDDVLDELISKLDAECAEWAPAPTGNYFTDIDWYDSGEEQPDPRAIFESALVTVAKLLDQPIDIDLRDPFLRLLYANVISAVEAYLADTFIGEVLKDDKSLRTFVQTYEGYKDRSVKFTDMFARVETARQDAVQELTAFVWHRLPAVREMYRDTLGVKVGIGDLAKTLPTRHHIVHRNGVDKDGNPILVSAINVRKLIVVARELASGIEKQLATQKGLSDPGF